ncbi:hypothetical protein ACFRFU_52245 [Streptomyces sp. NPDC056704]|uniref:hypothetical protein n=1 Tax=Streptomyces sp. NPDC056704 TaxID=3345917 RepID=UPI0036C8B64B
MSPLFNGLDADEVLPAGRPHHLNGRASTCTDRDKHASEPIASSCLDGSGTAGIFLEAAARRRKPTSALDPAHRGTTQRMGALLALSSALGYGIVDFAGGILSRRVPVTTVTFLGQLGGLLFAAGGSPLRPGLQRSPC